MELVVSEKSKIDSKGFFINEKIVFENLFKDDIHKYFKSGYRHLKLSYPKFFKMDRLSKLCLLSTDLLLKNNSRFSEYKRDKIGIILTNYSSSYDADLKHFETISDINNYYPSPSIFVYTLPNIMIGELCIKYKINGEGSCFLLKDKGKTFIYHYIRSMFLHEDYQCCITGYVDYRDDLYLSELFLIEKKDLVEDHIINFDCEFNINKSV